MGVKVRILQQQLEHQQKVLFCGIEGTGTTTVHRLIILLAPLSNIQMASIATTPTTDTSVGKQLDGIWKEVHIENNAAFLAAIGIGWLKRKAAALLMKAQTHMLLYNDAAQTIIIRTEGKIGGPDENKLNIGTPTNVTATTPGDQEDTTTNQIILNLSWNETKDILLNDLEVQNIGALHVERLIVGEQMKVEVTHVQSGVKMHRLFDKVVGSEKRVSEGPDGTIAIENV